MTSDNPLNIKHFKGGFTLRRILTPCHRHRSHESAVAEAGRLLDLHPETEGFVISQEIGRVKRQRATEATCALCSNLLDQASPASGLCETCLDDGERTLVLKEVAGG